jgi:hypothetical protein
MRSTELHGERRGLNLHLEAWVVRFRRFFLKVWILRNVRDQFQNFVTDHFSAAAAKREDGVAHQDHAGARLVLMAYLVDPRLLDKFSGNQRAIALIECFNICVLQFHSGACFCSFLPSALERAALGSNSANQKWDAFRVATSWSAPVQRRSFAIFFSGNPNQTADSSSAKLRAAQRDAMRREYQI